MLTKVNERSKRCWQMFLKTIYFVWMNSREIRLHKDWSARDLLITHSLNMERFVWITHASDIDLSISVQIVDTGTLVVGWELQFSVVERTRLVGTKRDDTGKQYVYESKGILKQTSCSGNITTLTFNFVAIWRKWCYEVKWITVKCYVDIMSKNRYYYHYYCNNRKAKSKNKT